MEDPFGVTFFLRRITAPVEATEIFNWKNNEKTGKYNRNLKVQFMFGRRHFGNAMLPADLLSILTFP